MDYKDILDLILDEKDYTVGGGCSAALAGAMACGLIGMVVNLSLGKELGLTDAELDSAGSRLSSLKASLLEGTVRDREAYLKIRDAYRLPKDSEEEKAARRQAISEAGYFAASVPRDNALLNREVYEIALALEGKTNPNANTDFLIGKNLARLGIDGARKNIEVNLGMIRDEKRLSELEQIMADLARYILPEER